MRTEKVLMHYKQEEKGRGQIEKKKKKKKKKKKATCKTAAELAVKKRCPPISVAKETCILCYQHATSCTSAFS